MGLKDWWPLAKDDEHSKSHTSPHIERESAALLGRLDALCEKLDDLVGKAESRPPDAGDWNGIERRGTDE